MPYTKTYLHKYVHQRSIKEVVMCAEVNDREEENLKDCECRLVAKEKDSVERVTTVCRTINRTGFSFFYVVFIALYNGSVYLWLRPKFKPKSGTETRSET